MADIARDILNAVKTEVSGQLPVGYRELSYVIDPAKNSFRGGKERYGIAPLGAVEVPGTTGFVTMDQTYKLILTNGYASTNVDDTLEVSRTLDLLSQMDVLQRHLIKVQAVKAVVTQATVIHVTDFTIEEPTYLDDNVVVLQATLTIRYRKQL